MIQNAKRLINWNGKLLVSIPKGHGIKVGSKVYVKSANHNGASTVTYIYTRGEGTDNIYTTIPFVKYEPLLIATEPISVAKQPDPGEANESGYIIPIQPENSKEKENNTPALAGLSLFGVPWYWLAAIALALIVVPKLFKGKGNGGK